MAVLRPDQRLRLERGDRFVRVLEGILVVAVGDDDVILTPGDQLSIDPGERPRAWNAGDETARVIVGAESVTRLRAA